MAVVNVTYTFLDEKGKTKTNKVHLPLGFSPAQYAEWALAFGDLLLIGSTAAITEIGISIPLSLSAATLKIKLTMSQILTEPMLLTWLSATTSPLSKMA
jgi:hypothetical protein